MGIIRFQSLKCSLLSVGLALNTVRIGHHLGDMYQGNWKPFSLHFFYYFLIHSKEEFHQLVTSLDYDFRGPRLRKNMFLAGVSCSPFYLVTILFSPNRSLDTLVGCTPMAFKFKYEWPHVLPRRNISVLLVLFQTLYSSFYFMPGTYT